MSSVVGSLLITTIIQGASRGDGEQGFSPTDSRPQSLRQGKIADYQFHQWYLFQKGQKGGIPLPDGKPIVEALEEIDPGLFPFGVCFSQHSQEKMPFMRATAVVEVNYIDFFDTLTDYENHAKYLSTQTESVVLDSGSVLTPSITIVQGKSLRRECTFKDVRVKIARLGLDIPYWPLDNTYTLLFILQENPQEKAFFIDYLQLDEENLQRIGGAWKEAFSRRVEKGDIDENQFKNDNRDMYGRWTVKDLGENKTQVTWEAYIDPPLLGYILREKIVLNSAKRLGNTLEETVAEALRRKESK